jgi:hypothetical protein
MGSSSDASRRSSRVSDEELLRAIGDDLRNLYAETIRQPLPADIEAALTRIEREQRLADNLRRAGVKWTQSALAI